MHNKEHWLAEETKNENTCPLNIEECPINEELERLRGECARLRELSRIDELTGFYNYRYFISALDGEMERTRRTGLAISLLMIDLDRFKKVNDTYGHEYGNKALQWCTKIWMDAIRKIDIPCRYGGEEFAIILPGTRLPQAVRTGERLRAALENSPVEINGSRIRLTASFGVETYGRMDDFSARELIQKADDFLLMSKANGRNRVTFRETDISFEGSEISVEERDALFKKK